MSITCPDCGAVAGYGREIGHKSDCSSLRPRPKSQTPIWDAATQAQRDHWYFMGFDPDNPDVPTD